MDEKYVLDNFYAFSRGEFFVALTNKHDSVSVSVPNVPFKDGTTVCNIFFPDTDCQTIQGGKINIYLLNGESKVYVPKGSAEN
jgi:alpha-amylase